MTVREKKFRSASEEIAFDLKQRKVINHNIGKYTQAVEKGKAFYSDLDGARKQAGAIKDYVLSNLDGLLARFEKKAVENKMTVLWAEKSDEIIDMVEALAEKHEVKQVVKSKSMVSEELDLNHHLEKMGIDSFETDLGEFIVQVGEERPFHILTPAMHKSKEDVADLFHKKFARSPNETPDEITEFVRSYLREKFMDSQMGFTGANFLIADTGSIALTENEGNGLMTASWPETMVIIAGIEKVIPGLSDLELFWPLVSVMGTGQHLTAYNSIFSGPRDEEEIDGPENVYVILFDGGRSRLFEEKDHHAALKCIRCGACLNYCPVYKNIGGFTYDTVYTGPIGSVISMYLDGTEDTGFLNTASSLCGKCTEVCPVHIPLHDLLLKNRVKMVEQGKVKSGEKTAIKFYSRFMSKRKKLERFGSGIKNLGMKTVGKKVWGKRRAPLVFAEKSFTKRYISKD